ncbi:hypothetical protein EVAR_8809_1 [Eumeta japonica]|uniref:Uncharacterized protein n=1 Tax=Eumeta variegata TaxID=151549 RepID=A0A4C1TTW6_EUMVA|nr:hypothetical protein EVAR_8809_1 [Eumeta japonica]
MEQNVQHILDFDGSQMQQGESRSFNLYRTLYACSTQGKKHLVISLCFPRRIIFAIPSDWLCPNHLLRVLQRKSAAVFLVRTTWRPRLHARYPRFRHEL